jgi:hypothetical protein
VEVDLTKPLLAMFTIKGCKYNVEYEGLHLLCTTCGRFGHYKEGCKEKAIQPEEITADKQVSREGRVFAGSEVKGPWIVVQKSRRNKKETPVMENHAERFPAKNNGVPASIKGAPIMEGSRFAMLSNDTDTIEEEVQIINEEVLQMNKENNAGEKIATIVDQTHEVIMGQVNDMDVEILQSMPNKKGNNSTNQENPKRDMKLAARGKNNFKNKPSVNRRKGTEKINEVLEETNGTKKGEAHIQKPKGTRTSSDSRLQTSTHEASYTGVEGGANIKIYHNESFEHINVGQHVVDPNLPRPPDPLSTPHFPLSLTTNEGNLTMEREEYVDASDGLGGTIETNVEVVEETPNLSQ